MFCVLNNLVTAHLDSMNASGLSTCSAQLASWAACRAAVASKPASKEIEPSALIQRKSVLCSGARLQAHFGQESCKLLAESSEP